MTENKNIFKNLWVSESTSRTASVVVPVSKVLEVSTDIYDGTKDQDFYFLVTIGFKSHIEFGYKDEQIAARKHTSLLSMVDAYYESRK